MSAQKLIALLAVGQKAIDHHTMGLRTTNAKNAYHDACAQWKEDRDIDRYFKLVEFPEQFEAMMAATTPRRIALSRAKKDEYNAKRRLLAAIRKAGTE